MKEEKSNTGKKVKSKLSPKRKRQYEHIKESEINEGKDIKTAKRIAMATVNKTRRNKGEVKKSRSIK